MSIAFVFPGQGSQSVGMLDELAAGHPQVEATFREAGEALGEDLWARVTQGPAAQLDLTEHTQPALLTAGVACWRVWQTQGGPAPAWMAGHSLGEYTALVCAGSIGFADGVRLVRKRAQLMQSAAPGDAGAMAAIIGMEDAAVRQLCAEHAADAVLQAVNFNAPGQVVIAGASAQVEAAMAAASEQGARMVKRLPISVPCHSDMMRAAAEQLSEHIHATPMQLPAIPVLHNVDAKARDSVEALRSALVQQLYSPVLWTDSVHALEAEGVDLLLECGPGRVLCGLARRINRKLGSGSLHNPEALQQALAAAKRESPCS